MAGNNQGIVPYSHYLDPLASTPSGLSGNSRNHGNSRGAVDPDVQAQVIQTIMQIAPEYGLSQEDVANVLAIVKLESGFNPDAAARSSSASGLFQILDGKNGVDDALRRLDNSSIDGYVPQDG